MKRPGFTKRSGVSGGNQGDFNRPHNNQQDSFSSNDKREDFDNVSDNRKRPHQVIRKSQVVYKRQMSASSSRANRPANSSSQQVSNRGQDSQRTSGATHDKRRRLSDGGFSSPKLRNDSTKNTALSFLDSLTDASLPDRGIAAVSFLDSLLSSTQPDVAPAKSAAVLFLQSLSLSLLAEDSKIPDSVMTALQQAAVSPSMPEPTTTPVEDVPPIESQPGPIPDREVADLPSSVSLQAQVDAPSENGPATQPIL